MHMLITHSLFNDIHKKEVLYDFAQINLIIKPNVVVSYCICSLIQANHDAKGLNV